MFDCFINFLNWKGIIVVEIKREKKENNCNGENYSYFFNFLIPFIGL